MFCSRSYLGPLNTMYLLSGWVSDFSPCVIEFQQLSSVVPWCGLLFVYLILLGVCWIFWACGFIVLSGIWTSLVLFLLCFPLGVQLDIHYALVTTPQVTGDGQFFQSLSALQFEWLLPLRFQFTGLFYSVWSVNDAHPRNFLSSIFFMICHPGISMPLFLYLSFPTLLSSLSFKPSGIPV